MFGTNDHWHKRICRIQLSWPVYSRSLSHDFAIRLLKYGTSGRVRSTSCTVLDRFFPYLAQIFTSNRGCAMHNDLQPIYSRSFNHDFARKLLKYGTSCHLCSPTCTVLDVFYPYLAQMITSMRGCIIHNDPWRWPISSRLFSYDVAYSIWHKYNPWGDDVSHTFLGQ